MHKKNTSIDYNHTKEIPSILVGMHLEYFVHHQKRILKTMASHRNFLFLWCKFICQLNKCNWTIVHNLTIHISYTK